MTHGSRQGRGEYNQQALKMALRASSLCDVSWAGGPNAYSTKIWILNQDGTKYDSPKSHLGESMSLFSFLTQHELLAVV